VDRNLWESSDENGQPATIVRPLDPADYGIDPLTFLA
jgi:hypothetical protein